MVYHVGFDLYGEHGLIYNTETKNSSSFNIRTSYNETNYFIKVLRLIVGQIQGELGCICFCWNYDYGENIKKDLINIATNFGFIKVIIIEEKYAKFRNAIEKSGRKEETSVLIIDKNLFTNWALGIQNEVKIGEELTEAVLIEIKKKLKIIPNLIVYYYYSDTKYNDKVVRVLFQKIFPEAFVFFTEGGNRQMFSDWALKEALENSKVTNTPSIVEDEGLKDGILKDYDVLTMEEEIVL